MRIEGYSNIGKKITDGWSFLEKKLFNEWKEACNTDTTEELVKETTIYSETSTQ